MRSPFSPWLSWSGLILAIVLVAAGIFLSPPDLLRKADYVGAAVCHRIPSHSFFIDNHQTPLCARCTGTFPGVLTGLVLQWFVFRRRRAIGFPEWKLFIPLVLFLGFFGLDGLNSYTTLIFNSEKGIFGYAPQSILRLLSGTLTGMGMSVILLPAFNQTFWKDGVPGERSLNWKLLGILIVVELVQAALIYSLEPWLLYPVAIYSALGVLTMFTLLGAMIFVMALGYDGRFAGWKEAVVPLLWGVVFAMVLVGGIDWLRFMMSGTLDGMPGV